MKNRYIFLLLCTFSALHSSQSSHELVFKIVEAGTDNGTVKDEIVQILQDVETSLLVVGVSPEKSAARVEWRMSRSPLLLCYKDNKLVAGVAYSLRRAFTSPEGAFGDKPDAAYMSLFFVDKTHRKQGIGTALLHELLKVIRQRQPECKELHLEVVVDNDYACRFYESRGFCKVGEYMDRAIQILCSIYVYKIAAAQEGAKTRCTGCALQSVDG